MSVCVGGGGGGGDVLCQYGCAYLYQLPFSPSAPDPRDFEVFETHFLFPVGGARLLPVGGAHLLPVGGARERVM